MASEKRQSSRLKKCDNGGDCHPGSGTELSKDSEHDFQRLDFELGPHILTFVIIFALGSWLSERRPAEIHETIDLISRVQVDRKQHKVFLH